MEPSASQPAPSSPQPPFVVAIIPHFQQREQLDRCLAALAASTMTVKPWVYDNNTNNIGFTKAINLGLKMCFSQGAEFALLLNQDCYVQPDAVANLVRFMQSHPHCGLAGIKQVSSVDPDFIIHGGGQEAYPAGMHMAGRKSNGDCAVSRPMPWVNGAAIFARMSAVQEIGLLDPNMVMIGSDSDWCYTARTRGWEVWYCAEAEAIHETGVTQKPLSLEMHKVFASDMGWWKGKWLGHALFNQLAGQIPYQPKPASPPSTQQPAAAVAQ